VDVKIIFFDINRVVKNSPTVKDFMKEKYSLDFFEKFKDLLIS
jgi:hypothetical protein